VILLAMLLDPPCDSIQELADMKEMGRELGSSSVMGLLS